jgi:hypothetical protein
VTGASELLKLFLIIHHSSLIIHFLSLSPYGGNSKHQAPNSKHLGARCRLQVQLKYGVQIINPKKQTTPPEALIICPEGTSLFGIWNLGFGISPKGFCPLCGLGF